MRGYYQIIDTITELLKQDVFCKTVTSGSIYSIAVNKQSIYPISHIVVNGFKDIGNAFSYNISIISMDLVTEDDANEQDVIHTQSMVGVRLCELLKRGAITDKLYQILENPSYEFFRDRFENKVAGCTTTFDVVIPNDMTIC